MAKDINGIHKIASAEFHIKSAEQLKPIDITLHPIYRPDGMMLVNRYTTLLPFMLTQIQKHLKEDMPIPIIVASSEEMLDNFINDEIYKNPEFVMILDNVIKNSIQWYNIPLTIDAFIDERVDIKSALKAVSAFKASRQANDTENSKKVEKNENNLSGNVLVNRYTILGKITSSSSIWGTCEQRLASGELQNRVKSTKKKFLNILNEDNALIELLIKMSIYDDVLLIHGVNLACISIIIGTALGITDEDLINLAITSLFCNIGFIKMEKSVFLEYLNDNYDNAIIGEHIKKSLEIISISAICRNKSIIFGILEHHEFYNGSGFPASKRGKDICMFGRILAIALKYESYLKEHFHGDLSNMNNIEKMICRNKDNKYDPDILNIYMKNAVAFM